MAFHGLDRLFIKENIVRRIFHRTCQSHGKAAEGCRTPQRLPFRAGVVFVFDVYGVGLEAIDGFDGRRIGGAFQPAGGAPRVLAGGGHEAVFYGILMDIVQPGQIGFFVGEEGVPVLIPDFALWGSVEFIDPTGQPDVEGFEHRQ